MKKMILVAAIVCAATMVNAAACQWALAGIADSETTKAAKDSMVAYFMDGATYDTFAKLDSTKAGAYAVANGLSSANTVVSRTGAQAGATFGSFDVGSEVSGYVVIFDNADATAANYYAYTAVESKSVPGAGNVQFSKTFTQTAGWQKIEAATPPPVTPDVPEPTSGLLLVLGGAALALRRRR